ncbi:MAG: flagellar assembly protein FliW [Planctomycetota bacterium]
MNGDMEISTQRFGRLLLRGDEILSFPHGLLGFEDCLRWVLISDPAVDCVAWLQSVDHAELALAVTSPRLFVPGYQVRVARRELEILNLTSARDAEVLVVVGRTERGLTANLKAPVVLHPERRLGKQVISNGDLPVQFPLEMYREPLRKSA